MLHGHGAKGAALARLTLSAPHAIRVYTPHGGSLVYRPGTLAGGFYRTLEWAAEVAHRSVPVREQLYRQPVPRRDRPAAGAWCGSCITASATPNSRRSRRAPDATDLVCLGELRPVKAFDVLIEALAVLNTSGRLVSATIAGEGPDQAKLEAQAERLGIADRVRFVGYRPAREAFAMGRMLVIPSRAESLPYVVLEAAAAGMPIIATRVGGIPEIFGPQSRSSDSAGRYRRAWSARSRPRSTIRRSSSASPSWSRRACGRSSRWRPWSMAGLAAYREAMALRKLAQFA